MLRLQWRFWRVDRAMRDLDKLLGFKDRASRREGR
jgi:hypothetical protein